MGQLSSWELPDKGVLFVVTGPSGVGKSTLIRSAIQRIPGLTFSVSATTRMPRRDERNGHDYHFMSTTEFEQRLENDEFLESAKFYHNAYGTLVGPTDNALNTGHSLLLDIDLQGARQIRQKMPHAVLIFILPKNIETLEKRLNRRATDSSETIKRRMAVVREQLSGCEEFDYLVVNDDLETAHATFQGIFLAEMSRTLRRKSALVRL